MAVHLLTRIMQKRTRTVIGLMSGTSTDGIDAALVRIQGSGFSTRIKELAFHTVRFSPTVRKKLLRIQDTASITLEELARLHFAVGELFAGAALALLRRCGHPKERVDLIGSHGHTIAHYPKPAKLIGVSTGATMQIGDPGVIARRTGIVTVGDFRSADVAAGGEGAPLVPYFDFLVFRSEAESRGLLNIGGISNLTVLRRGCAARDVSAFDCGPGNMIVDYLMNRFFGRPYDKNGRIAANGMISKTLLQKLLAHPFLKRKPPRSTGREEFGPHYGEKVIRWARELGLTNKNTIATVTSFTAEAIARAYRRYVEPEGGLNVFITGGGGAHNGFMMGELARLLPEMVIRPASAYGVSPDSKEALAFAVLANETISGNPGNLKNATGAREEVVLGKICVP